MGLKEWIVPQDTHFFDLLDAMAANAVACADALKAMMDDYRDLDQKRRAIHDLEHRGDELVHDLYERLAKSFITPFDQEDITKLASGIDDLVDYTDATANALVLYKIEAPTDAMRSIASLIQRQAAHLREAVKGLRTLSKPADIERACIEVHSLENAADAVWNEAMGALFQHTDAVHILKYKEVYETLETATDKAEDAANIIHDVVMKNS